MIPTLPSPDSVRPTTSVKRPDPSGIAPSDDVSMSDSLGADDVTERRSVELVRMFVRIVVWTAANLTVFLVGWVMLGSALGGWSPAVITSDSSDPALDTGDVILVDDEAEIGRGDVVVFERDDSLVAHTVTSVANETVTTTGSVATGAAPDVDRVNRAEVLGTGRLVIPLVGLPLVWAQTGDWLPLAGWLLLTGAGVVSTVVAAGQAIRRRNRRKSRSAEFSVARVGIQRVRLLTAALLAGQVFIAADGSPDLGDRTTIMSLGAVGILVATNVLGAAIARPKRNGTPGRRSVAVLEIVIDTALVVLLTTSTDSGLSWILFALPIIEAAVRFRLVGALLHWMGLTAVMLTIDVWESQERTATSVVRALEARLDQLGVLFLFVIPASYLAEQMLGEVVTWQRATGQARRRSELLARVADVGRDVSRLDGGHVSTILAGLTSMGFDRADLVTRDVAGRWSGASKSGLPTAGGPASCTRDVDLRRSASIVTRDDADRSEADALAAAGLAMVISQVISDQHGRLLVLRAGVHAGNTVGRDHVEAFRLLAGQATVALQNDDLMNEVTSMHDELEHRALHDALTGLPNRTMLLQRLRDARIARRAVAVLFLDLDGFKPVNDRLGHDVGDILLEHVARRLQETAPQSSLVARLGGDEFTVIQNISGPDETLELADRIVGAIRTPFEIGDQMIHISTSVGISYSSDDADDAELVRRADVAMYEAKHGAGEGSVEVYRADLDLRAERRAQLAADIEGAIAEGTLHLTYQPFVDVGTGRVVGAEALLRWDHSTFGRVPPGETIDAALASGMSTELNRHISSSATSWVSSAQAATGDPTLFVAINASPDELNTPGLALNIARAIELAGVEPTAIAVEISERVVTPVSATAQRNMEDLQSMGVRLLLDDFGEGTTSLTYLQELPISGVKLDRRLVVNAVRSTTDRLVLESIAHLSVDIGLAVIAEGIETAEHLAAVESAGCSLAQGYHLFRPMSGDELIDVLNTRASAVPLEAPLAPSPDDRVDVVLNGDDAWTRPMFGPTADVGAPFSAPAVERPEVAGGEESEPGHEPSWPIPRRVTRTSR